MPKKAWIKVEFARIRAEDRRQLAQILAWDIFAAPQASQGASMKFQFIVPAAALMFSSAASAETLYGSFRFDDRAPNSLFLTGDIREGDSFELRKALRDHDVQIVIMGSAGGNLYEGLQMGAILRDKGIATYVPPKVSCESSCANMFFGGARRKAEGRLGVHQFYSKDGDRSASLGEAEETTQYTMADVIGIMNELDTPPFVYEKMLGTTDIYYFPEDELRRLDVEADAPEFVALQGATNLLISQDANVVARLSTAAEPATPAPQVTLEPSVSTNAPATQTSAPPGFYDATDFFGADLSSGGVRDVSLAECEQICRADASCAAWSYVHETRWCWPKSAVSNVSWAVGVTSGVTDYSRVDMAALERPFLEVSAADLPGYDILPRGMPNTSLDDCRRACEASNACHAFTWISKKNICFPKYAAGQLTKVMGAISGFKR